MIRDQIIKAIQKVSDAKDFNIEIPENSQFGDYSSNVALKTVEKGQKPRDVAEELINQLQKNDELLKVIEKVEVAGPGFINFWISKDLLLNNLTQIDNEKEKYGTIDEFNDKLAIVEYSSPNIAKPFTVGHLRSTIIGDAVANLLGAIGWKVLRDNHLGDWGTQFGKQIYAIKTWGNFSDIEKSENPVKELVALYVKFHEEAENDPSIEDGAREWFKKLEDGDREALDLWQKCVDLSWKEFDKIYKELGVTFSKEFNNGRGLGEAFFENKMKVVIDELEKNKLLKEGEEGAKLVFFEKDKYPPAMILKKDGTSLYHTRDLATDKYRKENYNPDLIINEVGLEQKLYFEQLYEIETMLGWYKTDQRVHVGHGLIRFKEGKMSTRKGNVIWLEDVLSEAHSRAKKLGSESDELISMVAIGALKWNDLKRDSKTDIVFDWDEMLSMEGNSGPYLQYTHARAYSILEKAGARGNKFEVEIDNEEVEIMRVLYQFPEIIMNAAKNYSPNILANYLFSLAQKFNNFYNTNRILDSEKKEIRVEITRGVAQVLKNGLKLLGIESPEKM